MASLEDTFRIMNGEEPVNTNRLTAEDKNLKENRGRYKNVNGQVGGKITKDFMSCVTATIIEERGGVRPQTQSLPEKQSELVENAKVLTALLNSIRDDRLDERVLLNVAKDIRSLTEHLSVYPEFTNIIERRIK